MGGRISCIIARCQSQNSSEHSFMLFSAQNNPWLWGFASRMPNQSQLATLAKGDSEAGG